MKVSKAIYLPEKELRPLLEQWQKECNCKEFGIEANIESHLSDLSSLIRRDDADLLLLKDDEGDKLAGYMGLTYFKSPLGEQRLANEHYFYILPQYRGMSAVRMINFALEWARERGCSHLVMNASRMASSTYGRACMLYERLKFKEFEKSYILQI